MFRVNRGRLVGISLTLFIVYFLFLSSTNSNSDFRKRTEEGLSRRHGVLQGDLTDEAFRAMTNEKLNEILAHRDAQQPLQTSEEASGPAPAKEPSKEDNPDRYSGGAAGRKTASQRAKEKEKPKYPVGVTNADGKQDTIKDGDSEESKKSKEPIDPGKDLAREKLQEYLKKPIVIFSKSYCPHSKRAKHLLLTVYKIIPTPLVVELDQLTEHVPAMKSPSSDEDEEDQNTPTLGQKLQELLLEISGRRTVPNIIVGGGTSIGGNDLLWQMHEEGTLAERIRDLGGKRISSVELVGEEHGQ